MKVRAGRMSTRMAGLAALTQTEVLMKSQTKVANTSVLFLSWGGEDRKMARKRKSYFPLSGGICREEALGLRHREWSGTGSSAAEEGPVALRVLESKAGNPRG